MNIHIIIFFTCLSTSIFCQGLIINKGGDISDVYKIQYENGMNKFFIDKEFVIKTPVGMTSPTTVAQPEYSDLIRKSKTKKTVGIVYIIGGRIITVTGLYFLVENGLNDKLNSLDFVILGSGCLITTAGILELISGSKLKKEALKYKNGAYMNFPSLNLSNCGTTLGISIGTVITF